MIIQGRVSDSKTNEPIPIANIYMSDASGLITSQAIGTTSWFDGTYKFDNRGEGSYITCSMVGYVRKTVPVNNFTGIHHFSMVSDSTVLPEVEITAPKITWWSKNKYYALAGVTLGAMGIAALTAKKTNKNRK